jgi:prolipoprotein diacylglyceryltransferase
MMGEGIVFAIWGLGVILWIIGLAAIIWVIYDVVTRQKAMPDGEKVIWIIVALFLNIIGAIIYYIVVKASHKYEKEPEENIENPDEPIVF